MSILLHFTFLLIIPIHTLGIQRSESETLELVHLVFRHGDRTPTKFELYPTDPYKSSTFYPMGHGQLTNEGKRKAYELGKVIRKRYRKFLGEIYTPDLIKGICTDYDRTKMSIQLVLSALFPPNSLQRWKDSFDWMPIPYHYEKLNLDYVLQLPFVYCPKYNKEVAKLKGEEEALILNQYQDLVNYTSVHSGKKMRSLLDLFFMYQVLHHESNMGLELPQWTNTVYPNFLHEIALKRLRLESGNILASRLKGGRFLSKVLKNLDLKMNGTDQQKRRKMYLYSAHENNVFNLLHIFDVKDFDFPEYCSAVMIELHLIELEYYIRVLYMHEVTAEPIEISVRGCTTMCPLNQFVDKLYNFLPVNYTAECESNIPLD